MEETPEILNAARALRERNEEAVLATVIATDGSTYRRPGARMLIDRTGRVAGSVSGGCLEADVVRKAWWRTEAGPSVVTYDSRTDEDDPLAWAFGLGCNGVVQVLLERLPATPDPNEDVLGLITRVRETRTSGVIVTITDGPQLGQRSLLHGVQMTGRLCDSDAAEIARLTLQTGMSRNTVLGAEQASVFVEALLPPPALALIGSGPDVAPLAQMGGMLGWHVTVAAPRALRIDPSCYPGASQVTRDLPEPTTLDARTAVILMAHNLEADEAALRHVLPSRAGYIGMLGPRRRAERLFQRLGGDLDSDPRIHAPVGLDIGAEGGAQVAVSIIAEVQAWLSGREGQPLRTRDTPIHPRDGWVPASSDRREEIACGLG